MITIVDYGMGNLRSVYNAVSQLGFSARVSYTPAEIADAEKLILPGVGSFRQAMHNIRSRRLAEPLATAVADRRVPVLGICLGMQLLAEYGHEDGGAEGLGWIAGEVVRFEQGSPAIRLPHVGFNSVWSKQAESRVFGRLVEPADFYFVHSYKMECRNQGDIAAWCNYNGDFAAGVEKENVFGTQFHPEKSQSGGLALLGRFLRV